jgi:hypothetical protein
MGVHLHALRYLALGHAGIVKGELLVDSEEVGGPFTEPTHLFLQQIYLVLLVVVDALYQKPFYLRLFEEVTHYQVVHVLVFYQLAALGGR